MAVGMGERYERKRKKSRVYNRKMGQEMFVLFVKRKMQRKSMKEKPV